MTTMPARSIVSSPASSPAAPTPPRGIDTPGSAKEVMPTTKRSEATQRARFSDARRVGLALAQLAFSALLFLIVMRLAVAGSLPSWVIAVLAPASFLSMLMLTYRVGVALNTVDGSRPLLRRHGFWVVAIATVIGLPALGTSGLIDPWETHYAEVAREMLERHDFVSPWWAHEGWFMSKPVLTFWLEAIAMAIFGVRTGPDQVLAGSSLSSHFSFFSSSTNTNADDLVRIAHPEWAVRFPGFALALIGSYFLYDGVSRTCGKRAGLLGALALWTMPGFALLSHQAMTDMPLVACVAASLGFLLRALSTTDTVLTTRYVVRVSRRKAVAVHAGHAVALLIALVTLSQVVMLLLQHVHHDALGFHIRPDRLLAGSPHACTLPGQPACAPTPLAHPRLPPSLQAVFWVLPSLWLITRAASETRVARLLSLMAWMFAALAAMAKGPAGLAVPAAAVIVHALAHRSITSGIREVLRLELIAGIVLAITMIGPWYLAVYARHGRMFIDELVMRHMLGRTLDHLHDTNEGEDVGIVYFIRQLGYATFPWCGIALCAVLSAARGDEDSRRGRARSLLFGAAVVSFLLVSFMRTKFHHYILVALPPIAMLAGIWLDELVSIATRKWPVRGWGRGRGRGRGRIRSTWAAAAAITIACLVALVGRDLATTSDGLRGPARFVLLLTYRYARSWPSTTAFSTALIVLTALVAIAALASASRALRAKALLVMGGCAIVFTIVLVDVYFARCSSDGGQRDVIAAYYKDRGRATTPLIAYQLNWKGENFYTGNHLAIFVSSGAPMKTYLERVRAGSEAGSLRTNERSARTGEQDQRTVYFVTERGRVASLQHELGAVQSFRELTGADVSAEFTLIRVQL